MKKALLSDEIFFFLLFDLPLLHELRSESSVASQQSNDRIDNEKRSEFFLTSLTPDPKTEQLRNRCTDQHTDR
jgi:hypothetical protein